MYREAKLQLLEIFKTWIRTPSEYNQFTIKEPIYEEK